MAKYVQDADFRKYAFIEETDDTVTDNIALALESAEAEVENDLDYALLSDYVDDEGNLAAPLRKAILMKALQCYDATDDLQHSGVTVMHNYEKAIKPYVRLTEVTRTTTSTSEEE